MFPSWASASQIVSAFSPGLLHSFAGRLPLKPWRADFQDDAADDCPASLENLDRIADQVGTLRSQVRRLTSSSEDKGQPHPWLIKGRAFPKVALGLAGAAMLGAPVSQANELAVFELAGLISGAGLGLAIGIASDTGGAGFRFALHGAHRSDRRRGVVKAIVATLMAAALTLAVWTNPDQAMTGSGSELFLAGLLFLVMLPGTLGFFATEPDSQASYRRAEAAAAQAALTEAEEEYALSLIHI